LFPRVTLAIRNFSSTVSLELNQKPIGYLKQALDMHTQQQQNIQHLTSEDGSNWLSQDVGKNLPLLAA